MNRQDARSLAPPAAAMRTRCSGEIPVMRKGANLSLSMRQHQLLSAYVLSGQDRSMHVCVRACPATGECGANAQRVKDCMARNWDSKQGFLMSLLRSRTGNVLPIT